MASVDAEVAGPLRRDPPGRRRLRDQRVHRVRRLEAERAAAWPAEGLQQLLDDLVRAVGRPGAGPRQAVAEITGQRGPQGYRVPVRIAIQAAGHLANRR